MRLHARQAALAAGAQGEAMDKVGTSRMARAGELLRQREE